MKNTTNKSILIVDDHSIVHSGIQLVLELNFPFINSESVFSGNEMLEKLKQNTYSMVILDINMPDTDTHSLLFSLFQTYPNLKILIYSMSPEELYSLRFFQLGVYGFLSKDAPNDQLVNAIQTILNGEKYFSPKTVKLLSDKVLFNRSQNKNVFDSLSVREFEIMTHLIKGVSIKELSIITNLHTSTLGTHKSRIFRKLGVNNLMELKELARIHNLNF